MYNGIYENSSNIDGNDYSKDFEKFTDISSPRSYSSSTKSSKISFKDLVIESYEDYLNKIKTEYCQYKINHFGHMNRKNNSLISLLNQTSDIRSLPNLPTSAVSIYQSSQKIFKLIQSEFFAPSDQQFKLSKEILEKKREEIEKYCRELIEKCGDVEFEIERILEHCPKLYNYINKNLEPLSKDLNFSINRMQSMKNDKNIVKKNFLFNSARSMQLGLKKRNLSNIMSTINNIKSLKDILELLKILTNNPSKYQVTQELLNKGKDLISNIRQINSKKTNNIKIIKHFEDEFIKLANKSIDKIQIEFSNLIKEQLLNLISVSNEKVENFYDIDLQIYVNSNLIY